MLASASEIKGRIDSLRLSSEGYKRQLSRAGQSPERHDRLKIDIALLEEEIGTLEKLGHLVRLEPDAAKVEVAVAARLEEVRSALSTYEQLSGYPAEQRDSASGEARALLWALGRDPLTLHMQELVKGHEHADPARTDRAIPSILIHTLEEAPDPDSRASAAYQLGQLHLIAAIPHLVQSLGDHPIVREIAMTALSRFTQSELQAAGVRSEIIQAVHPPEKPPMQEL
ncbi:MAG TPA: HEAT repeat domain-containing protein [Chloroflexia bacterium]|nr:HEAT repeat domain-containing protein [Chloroflexia bacterium]